MSTLCMSGYSNNAVFRDGVLRSTIHYLENPFTAEALQEKVRDILSSN